MFYRCNHDKINSISIMFFNLLFYCTVVGGLGYLIFNNINIEQFLSFSKKWINIIFWLFFTIILFFYAASNGFLFSTFFPKIFEKEVTQNGICFLLVSWTVKFCLLNIIPYIIYYSINHWNNEETSVLKILFDNSNDVISFLLIFSFISGYILSLLFKFDI